MKKRVATCPRNKVKGSVEGLSLVTRDLRLIRIERCEEGKGRREAADGRRR